MDRHVVIVGGGLAGLSAGAYARASGFRTTIVEHNVALGGVCTAWPRGAYVVDGCIHWLTGGAFARLYEELGIVPAVELRTLERWATWRDASDGSVVEITRNLDALARELRSLAPEDAAEVARIIEGASRVAEMRPPIDPPQELATTREQLRAVWELREALGTLVHFRKPIADYCEQRIRSPQLARLLSRFVPGDAPALVLLMTLGYLARGWISRPVGGTARFRDALVRTYVRLGGEARLHATVDEILVANDRAVGVRLGDGTIVTADAVVSTASTPETILRLLGGRYGADALRARMQKWKTFRPIVLASFGVADPLEGAPSRVVIDGIEPFELGGAKNDHLYVRICNDDPSFAPEGHCVVQAMLETDYDWWAKCGTAYTSAKDFAAEIALEQLEHAIPGIRGAVRMTDVATPLTFWNHARAWRGAYEGWMPNADSLFGHIDKRLAGLDGFVMAGQWVEPGGGVPMAIMSGRQAAQILCAEHGLALVTDPGRHANERAA